MASVRDQPGDRGSSTPQHRLHEEFTIVDQVSVNSLLDALPIAEMAALVRTTPVVIRETARGSIMNAVRHGVAPEEAARRIGVTMRAALRHLAP